MLRSQISGPRCTFKATRDPGPSDDSSQGWAVGSRWINVSNDRVFTCVDASPGNAIWREGISKPAKGGQGLLALTTTSDGSLASSDSVSDTPTGAVRVRVNGHGVSVGDASKLDACYFSGDGGTTPRARDDVRSGDRLYWNGSIAGYQLEADDLIDLEYNI